MACHGDLWQHCAAFNSHDLTLICHAPLAPDVSNRFWESTMCWARVAWADNKAQSGAEMPQHFAHLETAIRMRFWSQRCVKISKSHVSQILRMPTKIKPEHGERGGPWGRQPMCSFFADEYMYQRKMKHCSMKALVTMNLGAIWVTLAWHI